MDEPFGGRSNPIVRACGLQEELLSLAARVEGRRIVFVTHDIDEAIRLRGIAVAVLKRRPACSKQLRRPCRRAPRRRPNPFRARISRSRSRFEATGA